MNISNELSFMKFELVEVECRNSMEEAQKEAISLAVNTYGQVCPVILFFQGGRLSASTSMPAGLAVKILSSDPVDMKSTLDQVKNSYNRPIDKDHVKAVCNYLVNAISNQEKYILPSLTVTATKKQKVFTINPTEESFTQLGYIVLSLDDNSLTVTDGQHRLEGIRLALQSLKDKKLDQLKSDGVSIMFSFESNLNQVHQDFADCAKTKALPKSMISVYDRRVPVNRLTLDAIELCTLFNDGLVDSTSSSLSKKSNCLLLTSSVRNLMKALFLGNHSMADKAFDTYANKNMQNPHYSNFLDIFLNVINTITKYNPVLKEISLLERGPQRQKIIEYREKYLIANPLGLSVACKAIHNFTLINKQPEALDDFIRRLMLDINWEKNAEIWQGNVIVQRGDSVAIANSNKPVELAIKAISQHLGINLNIQEALL